MNSTKNNTTFPQVVEIPAPLEIHPSVSPKAAELLMRVAERIARTPESYGQNHACGTVCCILGHCKLLIKSDPALTCHQLADDFGLTMSQLESIYRTGVWPYSCRPKTGVATAE